MDDAIDEGVRAQLLVVEADGSVSLRHALLAEALYADLLPGERRAVHARLVDALEQVADVRPGEVAEHADRAGDARRSLSWSLRAAQAAEDVYAYDEAHRQYDRVRRLWPAVPDAEALVGADAVDVFSRAASIAAICDHDVDAVEIIERVRSWLQADPDVDPVRLGLLEAQYARFLLDDGRTDAALVAARRAVDLVPADPPTPGARGRGVRPGARPRLGGRQQRLGAAGRRGGGHRASHRGRRGGGPRPGDQDDGAARVPRPWSGTPARQSRSRWPTASPSWSARPTATWSTA